MSQTTGKKKLEFVRIVSSCQTTGMEYHDWYQWTENEFELTQLSTWLYESKTFPNEFDDSFHLSDKISEQDLQLITRFASQHPLFKLKVYRGKLTLPREKNGNIHLDLILDGKYWIAGGLAEYFNI